MHTQGDFARRVSDPDERIMLLSLGGRGVFSDNDLLYAVLLLMTVLEMLFAKEIGVVSYVWAVW